MTPRLRHFQVDPRRVVHETIDGETIIIDLDLGTYYSLRGCAPAIWALLVQGLSEPEVLSEMNRRFTGEGQTVSDATLGLIARLREEGLIEDAAERERDGSPPTTNTTTAPSEFEEPRLEKYTDMQYFLLLDPIHEVEEGGWPDPSARESPRAASA